jgi:hypothetical protein
MSGDPVETIRNLFALADQDNEEGRTAAHTAIKLVKKHGFVITVASQVEAPRSEEPRPRRSDGTYGYQPQPAAPQRPGTQRWRGGLAIVADEVTKFFQTLNVLPKDIPITGVQLSPAAHAGFCTCGHRYLRGELVSRARPIRCARCMVRRR